MCSGHTPVLTRHPPGSTHHNQPSKGCATGCTTPEELPNACDTHSSALLVVLVHRVWSTPPHTVPTVLLSCAVCSTLDPCLQAPENPQPNHLASLCR
jgi:hypothetical protein